MKLLEHNGVVSQEFQSIIENTKDLLFMKDTDFVYIAASKAFAWDCCCCTCVEDVLGKTDYDLFSKEVADGYRADDLQLLASGRPMLEFAERYSSGQEANGRCLTTKYLLHDKEGRPAAIFGQYHDITRQVEEEVASRRGMMEKTSQALGRSFYVANYVDLTDHTYATLWAMGYVKKMMAGCATADQGFETFLNTLVKPEFVPKVREFCNMETLPQRLQGDARIDCEYLSNFADGWCRTSFYPTQWDDQGNLTHVLFVVSPVDAQDAALLDEGMVNKQDLKTIFDEVPGGIVLYDWDGTTLTVLRMSEHYRKLYGYSLMAQGDSPDFQRIHPDDLLGYQKAIAHALADTHALEYAFRNYNPAEDRYTWTQIDAISKPLENGHSLVYAMYTDINAQKEAELALEARIKVEKADYEQRIQSLLMQNADALCLCSVNLTTNAFSDVRAQRIIKRCADAASCYDELLRNASKAVFVPQERQDYLTLFNCQRLLELYAQGQTHISFAHFFRIGPTHTEYVETVLDLTENPVTGHVVGICYARSLNDAHMSRVLLDSALANDYLVAALVYLDTGEYYRYDAGVGDYCEHRQDYFRALHDRIADIAPGTELEDVRANLSQDVVTSRLAADSQYSHAFYGTLQGKRCRLEASYAWVDSQHNLALATLRNITDAALYEQYKYESEHDHLTGLLNRKAAFAQARKLLESHPDRQFVMAHCDVRHFHLYNTFYGEEAGDQLLCAIGDAFKAMGKDYEYWACGRLESDVFCAFFPVDMATFERHVCHFVKQVTSLRDDFPLQVAIGAYWVEDPAMPVEAMFTRATIAAQAGRKDLFGLVTRFDQQMEDSLQDAQEITSQMNVAIAEEQFEVYLQAKYSLADECPVGAEALVRWNHPTRGFISPGRFVPVIERNGYVIDLDRYMWEHVCLLLRGWLDRGIEPYPVSVNVSRVSMYSKATVPFLKDLVTRYRLDPKYLELELTESAYMDDPDQIRQHLDQLRAFGFKLLMDDFGSGYSSLNTLKDIPVDVIKLDMKFLSEASGNAKGRIVVESVVRMAQALGLPIVAEGVETREQADFLRSIGCEYAQGFLFAKPVPVREYEMLL